MRRSCSAAALVLLALVGSAPHGATAPVAPRAAVDDAGVLAAGEATAPALVRAGLHARGDARAPLPAILRGVPLPLDLDGATGLPLASTDAPDAAASVADAPTDAPTDAPRLALAARRLHDAGRDLAHAATWLARSGLLARVELEAAPAPAFSARDLLAIEGAATYVHDVLAARDSLVVRWPDRPARAIRVWIDPAHPSAVWDTLYVPAVRGAFAEWQEAGVPLTFAFVADARQADVRVRWTERFREPISGKTRWQHDARGRILNGEIMLATAYRSGRPLDGTAMRAIALHEIGHAIGLDHADDPGSIMAPLVRVRALGEVDARTARLLYRLPTGRLR